MKIQNLEVDPSKHEKLKQELKAAKDRNIHLSKTNKQLIADLHGTEKARRLVIPNPKKIKPTKDWIRVIIPDSHGSHIDRPAAAAFLNDLAALNPQEIVMLGDHMDCGGFLAQHHVLGYVAETTTTSYHDDCVAANDFLDQIQKCAPNAKIHYIEGNHERRVETWAVTTCLRHPQDAEDLRKAFAPEFRLDLKGRGITYYRRSEFYHGLNLPGAIKLGKCHFVHGISIAKNAAAVHVARFAGNVVYGDTHRGDWCPTRLVNVGIVAAWNPGCLCYDDKTEALTDRGFVLFKDLNESDRVAEYDPYTKTLVYRKPLAYQDLPYEGDLVRFKAPRVDLLVTPEHRMLVTKSGHPYTKRADEVAASLSSSLKVPVAGVFAGENTGITPDEGRLVGWLVSEGSLDTNSYGFRLTIYQKKKPHVTNIDMLLRRLKLKFSKTTDRRNGVVGFRISAANSREIVEKLFDGGSIRRISRTVLRSPLNVLEAVFDAAMAGDGSRTGKGSGYYATTSLDLAGDFQELCHKTGRSCLIKKRAADTNLKKNSTVYICGVCKFDCGDIGNIKNPLRETSFPYKGRVYDITTTTGYFMVRRNGVISISGNCQLQPLWNETKPTDWSHGYAIQLVRQDGDFLHVQVPIIGGVSLMGPMVSKITAKA